MSLAHYCPVQVASSRAGDFSLWDLVGAYLLVMDGLTQSEYENSTASELFGPRVSLTFLWISQHIKSCIQAGLLGCTPPSVRAKVWLSHTPVVGVNWKWKCP